jgi:regulator of replication initiation timing
MEKLNLPQFAQSEISPEVNEKIQKLFDYIKQLAEENRALKEDNTGLKEEIARLKKVPQAPHLRPNTKKESRKTGSKNKKRGGRSLA